MDYFTFDGKELKRFDHLAEAKAYASKSENVVIIAGKQESGPHVLSSDNSSKLIEVNIQKHEGEVLNVDVKVDGVSLKEKVCPLGICDGSGWSAGGAPDADDRMCPCNPQHPDNTHESV